MAFGNFGPDPTMVNMMSNIGREIINQMVGNGSIQNDVGNWLIGQLNMNSQVILNTIVQTAQQNNVQVDANIIQNVLTNWISNLLQSYAAQRQAAMQQQQYGYGRPLGTGYGYGNPGMYGMGGYGQPMQTGTLYNNINYSNPAAMTSGYGTGAAVTGGYGNPASYVQQSSVQTENANRFTASRPEPKNVPDKTQNSTTNGISYKEPLMVGDVKNIDEPEFKGVKELYRVDHEKYVTFLCGSIYGVKKNAADVLKVIKDKIGNGGFFAQVLVNKPKIIDAPLNEVSAILSKYEALFRAKIRNEILSMDSIKDTFTAFHVEFMQEKSEAAKAIEKYIVGEFNELVATNCLNGNDGGYLAISSLEDIMELYSENTKSEFIKKRQAKAKYKTVLGNLVLRAVAALFMQSSGYRILSISDSEDKEVIADLFAEESVNGLSARNSIFALKKSIDTKHIDGAENINALYKSLMQKTVVAVPRTLIFSNMAPGFWITGDYSKPEIKRVFVEPTNDLEFFIASAHKALNKDSLPTVTEMYLDYGRVRYRLTYGVTTDSAFLVEMKS